MRNVWKACALISLMGCWSGFAMALEITCQPANEREAKLSDAELCKVDSQSPGHPANISTSADVNALFGTSDLWVQEGTFNKDTVGTTNDLFTVVLTKGSWGGKDIEGEWSVAASFWQTYGAGVISMHVGNGNGNPDAFAWLLTPNTAGGKFSYKDLDGIGGGLSNLFLFGTGTPTQVPEANQLILLLIGMASLLLARRRAK